MTTQYLLYLGDYGVILCCVSIGRLVVAGHKKKLRRSATVDPSRRRISDTLRISPWAFFGGAVRRPLT